ncbi:MAG: single-stranded DNA-binding protein [Syntrophorhabdaceae bacterium]|nr:single-stranded DNA-binding protein [Syntrophorhabdaceae bacterium]
MNRLFLSGTINSDIEIYSSPKGEKILIFSLLNEDNKFSIEVVYKKKAFDENLDVKKTDNIIVEGALKKIKKGSQYTFRLEAIKIFKTEV